MRGYQLEDLTMKKNVDMIKITRKQVNKEMEVKRCIYGVPRLK